MALVVFRKPPACLSPSLCQLTAFEEQSRGGASGHQGTTCSKKGAQQGQEMPSVKTPHSCTQFPALEKPWTPPQPCLIFPAPTINSQGSRLVGGSPEGITCAEQLQHKGFFSLPISHSLQSGKSGGKPLLVTNQDAPSPLRELSWQMCTMQ